MWRNWRSGSHGKRGLRDEGRVRNVESGGENVLEDRGRGSCVSRGLDREPRHAPFSRTNQRQSYG